MVLSQIFPLQRFVLTCERYVIIEISIIKIESETPGLPSADTPPKYSVGVL